MPGAPRDVDAWMLNVRDPAEQANEGTRTLTEGGASASYRIAQLPSGRWAVAIRCNLEFVTGMGIPWREFESREECVAFFVAEARAFFEREKNVTKQRAENRRKILAALDVGLFGFIEPNLEPELKPPARRGGGGSPGRGSSG